jgi:hypothetical protein
MQQKRTLIIFLRGDFLEQINEQQNSNKLIGSWSGGKDSCLACYRAQ